MIEIDCMKTELNDLEERLGVSFKNKSLLEEALTHRSYLNEHPAWPYPHNERLEFLGDAVLELAVTEELFFRFPEKPEGELTNLRAALVNAERLGEAGGNLGIDPYLKLSRGEAQDTGRARSTLVANALEAVIGAIYLDQDYKEAKEFVEREIINALLDEVLEKRLWRDPKSLFQEIAQEKSKVTPTYAVLREWGPDHDKHFVVGVYVGEELVAEGEGSSKQSAEIEAARAALKVKGWE